MRFSMKALSTAVVLTVAASAAQAQEITFVGSSSGSFAGGSAAQNAALTYSGSTFNNTTANGFVGFGRAPNPGSNFNNFGSFSLLGGSAFTAGGTFNLSILFTQPGGIVPGGGTQTFVANLLGTVTTNGNGGVLINFGNPAQRTLTFATPTPGGQFTLTVNNVSLDAVGPGETATVSLTGNITGSVVPEPSTYALMGTGLAGLLGVASRRRRSVA